MDFKLQLFFEDNQRGGFAETYWETAADVQTAQNDALNLINLRLTFLQTKYAIVSGRISVTKSGTLRTRQTQLVAAPAFPAFGLDTGADPTKLEGNPEVALNLRLEAGLAYRGRLFLRGIAPLNYDGEHITPVNNLLINVAAFVAELKEKYSLKVLRGPKGTGTYTLVPITAGVLLRVFSHRIGMTPFTPRGRFMRRRA